MFDKILIANRGEIACRVIRTAKRLGIKTVAVCSEVDKNALHVEMADEAIVIGPAPSAESYLVIDKIVAACKESGAQAVHPGYGFLSENTAFAAALEAAGVVFIGPPAGAIAVMGDKIESKKLAADAGVPTVPGHIGVIKDAAEAVDVARDIGYPVMIKASAGGGGKGMRVAFNDDEAREGFERATSEAQSSFGDDRIFVEKFIEDPHHIEIQVLADSHGNIVYLGERECSIQRRHQKVIEEAPSPFIDEKTRAAMGAQAVALAKAVDYTSAGTVEFIVDKNKNFYFLEMNTRLQVEHPVTEYVTGLDLVEQMLRVAAGEKLSFQQKDVKLDGWAMEARLYAEDPLRGFLPSIGRLVRYREPDGDPAIRVDSGVAEGSEITMFYDPMIAKVVTHGPTRDAAIAKMHDALDGFYIRGINHNMGFLAAVMARRRFGEGRLTTNFIAEEFPDGFQGSALRAGEEARLLAVAGVVRTRQVARERSISDSPVGPGNWPRNWIVKIGDTRHPVTVVPDGDKFQVTAEGETLLIESDWVPGETLFHARIDEQPVTVQIDVRGPHLSLTHGGVGIEVQVLTQRTAELAARMPIKQPPDLSRFLLSPMPGLLVSLAVVKGQEVKAGEELAVVEAMKMENVLRAQRDATVDAIKAAPGDSLAVDQVILEFS